MLPSDPAVPRLLAHRGDELAAVDAAWAELADGHPCVLVVDGPRGSGRTALLRAALGRLPRTAVVLRARCTEAEQLFPLGVVGQLFDALPEDVAVPAPEQSGAPSPESLQEYFRTTRSLATRTPVVLAIDDLHLADTASLQWFSYITRRLEGLPVAVVVTVTSAAAEVLGELDPPVGTRVLRPAPLCAACTAEVAAELLGGALDPELAAATHVLSQGNPLVLTELVSRLAAAGVSPGSPDLGQVLAIGASTVSDTTLEWLHGSSPAAVDLLEAVAVLGPGAEPAVAAVLAGQGELVAAEAREVLVRAGLVEAGPPDRFRHPLLRDAVLARIPGPQRLALHARAAELLTRLGAPAGQAADHLMLVGVGDEARAVPVLRSAARDCASTGAWHDAVRYLRRALAESTDPAVSTAVTAELAAVELHHDLTACLRHAETVGSGSGVDAVVERALLLAPLASAVLPADVGSAARPVVALATALAGTPGAPAPLLTRYGALALLVGHRAGVRRWIGALTVVPPEGHPAADRALLAALAAFTAAGGGHARRSVRLARRCSGGAEDGVCAAPAVLVLAWAGELADATTWATRLVEATRTRHHPAEAALALLVRADTELRRGRLAVALCDAQDALRLAGATRAHGLHAAASALVAVVLVERGQLDVATEVLGRVQLPAESHPVVRGWVLHARSLLALAGGDAAQALHLAVEAGHQLASRGVGNPVAVPWRAVAVAAYLALDERAAAATVAAEELRCALRWGTPGAVGGAEVLCASTATGPERLLLARRGTERLVDTGLHLQQARAHGELAAALDDAGAADGVANGADEQRRRAVELATQCGATGLVAVLTGRPVAAVPGHPAPGARAARLTASEHRVTDLVVRGMSNQEVADVLCLSRRTVDTHLNRIYRKLDIRSRADLPEALGRLG